MKVLHIISGYDGGIPSFVRNIATAINHQEYRFDIISFTDYPTEFREDIAVTQGICLTMPRPKEVGMGKFIKQTRDIISHNGPYDVIECHMTGLYALMFKIIVGKLTPRYVIHAHASNDDLSDTFIAQSKRALDRHISVLIADQLTSCSKLASEFMFGNKVVKKKQVIHIPNGISPDQFMLDYSSNQKNDIKLSLGIPADVPVLGHVGRFNTQKNHPFMIEIIDHLAQKGRKFIWVFIGTGADEEHIKSMVNERGLESYVKFLGRREDAHILYQILDTFVLPSFYEGLPTVVVEAQAAGINSVIADTITSEVDLGLDMVEYISLDSGLETWCEAIENAITRDIPSSNRRLSLMKDKGFTNEASALIYEKFLQKELEHFEIGHSIQTII